MNITERFRHQSLEERAGKLIKKANSQADDFIIRLLETEGNPLAAADCYYVSGALRQLIILGETSKKGEVTNDLANFTRKVFIEEFFSSTRQDPDLSSCDGKTVVVYYDHVREVSKVLYPYIYSKSPLAKDMNKLRVISAPHIHMMTQIRAGNIKA